MRTDHAEIVADDVLLKGASDCKLRKSIGLGGAAG